MTMLATMTMTPVYFEMQLLLLILASIVLPLGIYGFLYRRSAIGRGTVMVFALLLLVIAGADVALLHGLNGRIQEGPLLLYGHLFSEQLATALYVLPAVLAGLGINLMSHVLIHHLNEAEQRFDHERQKAARNQQQRRQMASSRHWRSLFEGWSERQVLLFCFLCAAGIFTLDIMTREHIRLHVLYLFPLAVVARYCVERGVVLAAALLVTMAQIVTFTLDVTRLETFLTDLLVSLAATGLTLFMVRENRRAQLKLQEQANIDGLTGLANRRCFMATLAVEVTRQQRYGGCFCLAFIDLDGFKQLNDSQGHEAGDAALLQVAGLLQAGTRRTDTPCRLGGDEFALLLPNTLTEDGERLLGTLCLTIAERMQAAGYAVTASIGAQTFEQAPDSADQAMQQVDALMYEAKRRGKNQTVCTRFVPS